MRYVITVLFVFLLTILQTTVLHGMEIMGVIPNLILVAVICYSLLKDTKKGLIFGIVCGLLLDFIGGRVVGVNALLCMYIAYLCAVTSDKLFNNNIFVAVGFVIALSFLYEFTFYLLNFLLWGNRDLVFAFFGKIIPASVYNGLMTFLIYPLVFKLSDNRSNSSL